MQWISDQSSAFDLVCLTGDFLDTRPNRPHPEHAQVAQLKLWFKSIQTELFICSGNHDFFEGSLFWLKSDNKRWFGDGDIYSIKDVLVGSLGYEDYDFEKMSACDVLLTHVPPANTSVAKENFADFGCSQLRTALRSKVINPSYLLCGHVHSPSKNAIKLSKTIVSNPGGNHSKHQPSYCVLQIGWSILLSFNKLLLVASELQFLLKQIHYRLKGLPVTFSKLEQLFMSGKDHLRPLLFTGALVWYLNKGIGCVQRLI